MPAFNEKKRKEGRKEKAKKKRNEQGLTPVLRFNIERKYFFGNDEATTITIYPWLSFLQAQIQNDW